MNTSRIQPHFFTNASKKIRKHIRNNDMDALKDYVKHARSYTRGLSINDLEEEDVYTLVSSLSKSIDDLLDTLNELPDYEHEIRKVEDSFIRTFVLLLSKYSFNLVEGTCYETLYNKYILSFNHPRDILVFWRTLYPFMIDYKQDYPEKIELAKELQQKYIPSFLGRLYRYVSFFICCGLDGKLIVPITVLAKLWQFKAALEVSLNELESQGAVCYYTTPISFNDPHLGCVKFDLPGVKISYLKPESTDTDKPVFLADYTMKEPSKPKQPKACKIVYKKRRTLSKENTTPC